MKSLIGMQLLFSGNRLQKLIQISTAAENKKPYLEYAKELIEENASLLLRQPFLESPLHIAAKCQAWEFLELFLEIIAKENRYKDLYIHYGLEIDSIIFFALKHKLDSARSLRIVEQLLQIGFKFSFKSTNTIYSLRFDELDKRDKDSNKTITVIELDSEGKFNKFLFKFNDIDSSIRQKYLEEEQQWLVEKENWKTALELKRMSVVKQIFASVKTSIKEDIFSTVRGIISAANCWEELINDIKLQKKGSSENLLIFIQFAILIDMKISDVNKKNNFVQAVQKNYNETLIDIVCENYQPDSLALISALIELKFISKKFFLNPKADELIQENSVGKFMQFMLIKGGAWKNREFCSAKFKSESLLNLAIEKNNLEALKIIFKFDEGYVKENLKSLLDLIVKNKDLKTLKLILDLIRDYELTGPLRQMLCQDDCLLDSLFKFYKDVSKSIVNKKTICEIADFIAEYIEFKNYFKFDKDTMEKFNYFLKNFPLDEQREKIKQKIKISFMRYCNEGIFSEKNEITSKPVVSFKGEEQQRLFFAFQIGDYSHIQYAIEKTPESLLWKDADGLTILHLAVMRGVWNIFDFLYGERQTLKFSEYMSYSDESVLPVMALLLNALLNLKTRMPSKKQAEDYAVWKREHAKILEMITNFLEFPLNIGLSNISVITVLCQLLEYDLQDEIVKKIIKSHVDWAEKQSNVNNSLMDMKAYLSGKYQEQLDMKACLSEKYQEQTQKGTDKKEEPSIPFDSGKINSISYLLKITQALIDATRLKENSHTDIVDKLNEHAKSNPNPNSNYSTFNNIKSFVNATTDIDSQVSKVHKHKSLSMQSLNPKKTEVSVNQSNGNSNVVVPLDVKDSSDASNATFDENGELPPEKVENMKEFVGIPFPK